MGLKFIRPKHFDIVAEDIVRQILKAYFWLCWLIPFGAWKLYELIKDLMT